MKGYVDLQVNGYAGVDFNQSNLPEEDFHHVCEALRADSVGKFLPTVITDDLSAMIHRIQQIASFIESDLDSGIASGIHIEGPFISSQPGFVGAHPACHAGKGSVDDAMRLVDAGRGYVRLVTLAPEVDHDGTITQALRERGITVAAGHSNATLDELRCAIDSGLSMFTHLGNGCPQLMHRHDNIITRTLSLADQLSISLIADGHHVPWHTFRVFANCIPSEKLIIVSDAISAAGLGPGMHRLANQEVEVDEDGAAWAAGREHFAGCATTLPTMESLLKDQLCIDDQTCEQWMITNPAKLLGH